MGGSNTGTGSPNMFECVQPHAHIHTHNREAEFIDDNALLRSDVFDGHSPGDYLYLAGTYSVFVTRLADAGDARAMPVGPTVGASAAG